MTPSIFMDGKLLVGTTWVRPTDWQADEVELGLLPAMKGATPEELPALGDDQADDGGRGGRGDRIAGSGKTENHAAPHASFPPSFDMGG